MTIKIHDKRKIYSLQEEFNRIFPYLKIEFYSKPSGPAGAHSQKVVKAYNSTIGDCRTIHHTGNISINPQMTVFELENQFRDIYGIEIQLYRKSGNVWLDTSITDNWTLEEQNMQGDNLSNVVLKNK